MRRETADEVAADFRGQFGRAAEGVWSAPGRVNLIGEHTDYNQGLALPIALPQRTYVAARRRDDRTVRLWSSQVRELVEWDLDDLAPDTVTSWSAYPVGVLWALQRRGFELGGVELAVDGRVPLGAGLSSSAALECAVGVAVSEIFGLGLHSEEDPKRMELAALCTLAENDFVQAPTGGLDQLASLGCQEGHAMLLDLLTGAAQQIPLPLAGHDLAVLVMNTRVEHALVDGQYANRREACASAARALGVSSLREIPVDGLDSCLERLTDSSVRPRVRHVVTEIDRVNSVVLSLGRSDFDEVGRLFNASHESLRTDYEVSCPELDLAVTTARQHGALGARMTGGGFGGSAIALVPEALVGEVSDAVCRAFAAAGWREPDCFSVVAGAAAGRDR